MSTPPSNGVVGNSNADAGGRGVAVVDGGMLTEVDARGTGVGYSGVVDIMLGWVRGWWAA
jgi:hypothetical protein